MFSKEFWLDCLERAASTYVQALIGFLVAGATAINIDTLEAAALAAIPAALSVLKSAIATQVGDPNSASLLHGAGVRDDGDETEWEWVYEDDADRLAEWERELLAEHERAEAAEAKVARLEAEKADEGTVA